MSAEDGSPSVGWTKETVPGTGAYAAHLTLSNPSRATL